MNIEVGKYYRSRDGRKAFVACLQPFGNADGYPFWGFIDCGGLEEDPAAWDETGSFTRGETCKHDLVAEWHEPKTATVDVWVYLWHDMDGTIKVSVREQDMGYVSNALGVKKVTVTVTEGDKE